MKKFNNYLKILYFYFIIIFSRFFTEKFNGYLKVLYFYFII